jgi:D-alanine-D-alanine ligase
MSNYEVVVLSGGISSEREVSLNSGRAVFVALQPHVRCRLVEFSSAALPLELNPERDIIFPVAHGTFGEDGQLQQLLETHGFTYVGCDVSASALCMNKELTRQTVLAAGVPIASGVMLPTGSCPDIKSVIAVTGAHVVIKPVSEGSSVGLYFADGETEIVKNLPMPLTQDWLIERFIEGREMTVGILHGKPMGVVEICPEGGVYDFAHKYTAGSTQYIFPAPLSESETAEVRRLAQLACDACQCRDFARVDFRMGLDGHFYFLEINTLPGLTSTSLLPKSASCMGYSFTELAQLMIAPAIERFNQRHRN